MSRTIVILSGRIYFWQQRHFVFVPVLYFLWKRFSYPVFSLIYDFWARYDVTPHSLRCDITSCYMNLTLEYVFTYMILSARSCIQMVFPTGICSVVS